MSGSCGITRSDERLAYSIGTFVAATGISRSSTYLLIKRGELPTVKRAGRRLILADDAKAWLRGETAATP